MTEKVADPQETIGQLTQEVSPAEVWPTKPAIDGQVYGFVDPAHGTHMMSMTLETWRAVIRDVAQLKKHNDTLSELVTKFKEGRKQSDGGGRIISFAKGLIAPRGD